MDYGHIFWFGVFPYLSLTTFILGHLYRYFTNPFDWNPKSSEILSKEGLKYGVYLFHAGVLLAFVGHAGGLLTPQGIFDAVGIDGGTHTKLAIWLGVPFGWLAFVGVVWLLLRRLLQKRIFLNSRLENFVALGLLLWVIGTGFYNVHFGGFYILDTVAPWIRGIVLLRPDPGLMVDVPLSYKLHVIGAFVLFGVSPFTRLVHILSVPWRYPLRRYLVFRKHIPANDPYVHKG
jgi:nitrate reductase gamma subunit